MYRYDDAKVVRISSLKSKKYNGPLLAIREFFYIIEELYKTIVCL